jgi:gliding motility-associated-like protein
MKNIYALLLLLIVTTAQAQTDTEFWFVAPDCTSGHAESPNYLRVTALTLPATVTVSQPANPSFVPITVNVAANSVTSINLTPFLSNIENTPANQVLNKGLKITATNKITVYYEQASSLNTDIFPLKGKNALGTNFMVPTQNTWNNIAYNPTPYNSFEIVATDDNTQVTITPSQNIVGHNAGTAFTITLNKGQTFSAMATGTSTSNHLFGSIVTSNKPIAITQSDDSIGDNAYGGCADLAGDQIVPISLLGMKYISIQGYLTSQNDKVFIMAVQDGTQVKINGTVVGTLNKGQQLNRASNGAPMYIEADKPVSALHISGFGCEVGGAILPQIECTGSRAVGVTRSESKPIYFNILVKAGGEGSFTYNGNTTTITASQFQTVPNTNGEWKYARVDVASILDVGASAYVTNSTTDFHLGVIHGDASSGCRYGYFSDYNRFEAEASGTSPVCEGTNLQLNCGIQGSAVGVSFSWTGPNGFTSTLQNPIINNIATAQAGTYTCTAMKGNCSSSPSTVNVVVNPSPTNTASSNSPICAGFPLSLSTVDAGTGATYSWSGPNGFTSSIQNPSISNVSNSNAGSYTLIVTKDGCSRTLTTTVIINAAPTAVASNAGPYCEGQNIQLNGSSNNTGVSYSWSGPNGFSSSIQNPVINLAQQNAAGTYTLKVIQSGCNTAVATTSVTVNPGPGAAFTGGVSPVCRGANIQLLGSSPSAGVNFSWTGVFLPPTNSPNLTLSNVGVVNSGTYILSVSKNGCISTASFNLAVNNIPPFVATSNSPVCEGSAIQLSAVQATIQQSGDTYVWTGPNGFTSNTMPSPFALPAITNVSSSNAGAYTLTGSAAGCPSISSQVTVTVNPTPVANASSNTPVCSNAVMQLNAANTLVGTSFTWNGPNGYSSNQQNNNVINPSVGSSGTYTLTASLNGCSKTGNIDVSIKPVPSSAINASLPSCRFSALQLNNSNALASTSYTWSGPNGYTNSQQNVSINNYNYADTGKYYLTATTDGCTSKDSITATLKESPIVQFVSPANICQEANGYQLQASEATGIAGSPSFMGNGISSTGFFNPLLAGSGTHTLRYVYSASNGCSSFKEQTVTVYPTPIVDAGNNKTILSGGGTLLNATLTGNAASIVWSPALGLDNPAILNPMASPLKHTTYKMEVTTKDGCYAFDTMNVKVLGNIKIPNAFSPNGDGINDKWIIEGLDEMENCTVEVFNRNGMPLFKSSGYKNPWDGTYNGKPLPHATYYYIIRLNDGFRLQPFSGWVLLLK